jgi:hypothetical protein
MFTIIQGCGSRIRINLSCWINADPDPGGQNDPQK